MPRPAGPPGRTRTRRRTPRRRRAPVRRRRHRRRWPNDDRRRTAGRSDRGTAPLLEILRPARSGGRVGAAHDLYPLVVARMALSRSDVRRGPCVPRAQSLPRGGYPDRQFRCSRPTPKKTTTRPISAPAREREVGAEPAHRRAPSEPRCRSRPPPRQSSGRAGPRAVPTRSMSHAASTEPTTTAARVTISRRSNASASTHEVSRPATRCHDDVPGGTGELPTNGLEVGCTACCTTTATGGVHSHSQTTPATRRPRRRRPR